MNAPWFPPSPTLLETRSTSASMEVRYEDIAQDGRMLVASLPHAIGEVVWRHTIGHEDMFRRLLKDGVIPILTRLVIEGTDEPIPVTRPITGRGGWDLAHGLDARGEVDRLFLDIWCDMRGIRGRTHLPPANGDGVEVPVGRAFAEHVFTRPWGPPETRKVRRFDLEGVPPLPAMHRDFRPLASALELPPGATLLDASPVLDPSPITFGLLHTDSNQHVNSLVYLRLFEEALVRRAADHGAPAVLARWVEIGYRKPCFAGQKVRVRLSAFRRGNEFGAVGAFVPESDPETDRPYAYVAMGAR